MAITFQAATAADITARLVELLKQAEWNGDAAFDDVRRFDSTEWVEAFRRTLTGMTSRVAFVVAGSESWDDDGSTVGRMSLRRQMSITLLVSDRVLGNADAAQFGGSDNPGSRRLADIAIAAVSTTLISNPGGCHARPVSVEPVFFTETENTALPGRAACLVELEITGGHLLSPLSVGPHR